MHRRPERPLAWSALMVIVPCALAGGGLATGVSQSEPPGPAASRVQHLNLILSAATHGEMLPCGRCKQKAGGLGRRATIIEASRDTAAFVEAADGGDLLPSGDPDPQVEAFLIAMHAKLGYSALGVGEVELARGRGYLEDLIAPHADLAWVSANIVDATTREPLFKPYVLRPAGETMIAFTSILEPEVWQDQAASQPGVKVLPPNAALVALMPEMRRRAGLVVCFAHARYLAVRSIAEEVPGVDIIVASHKPRVENYPLRIGHARQVFFGGSSGRFLNWSNVQLGVDGPMPLNGRTFYLLDGVPTDSTVVREILAFFGTSEPPGDDEPEEDPEADGGGG